MVKHITKSVQQTQRLAARCARQCRGGEVFCLSGELGSGKTTFVQGFLRALGVKRPVTSPTFVLQKIYPLKHQKMNRAIHVDAFRIGTDTTPPLDLADHLNIATAVVLIEWPENLAKELRDVTRSLINFRVVSKSARRIEITQLT